MSTADRIALLQQYLGEATAEIFVIQIERDEARGERDAARAQLAALRKAVIQVARCASYAAALSGDIA